jgi:hypothetical protein
MDIKRKTCDIRTWKKFSTYPPPTLIHLSHRVETRSIEVFWLLSQPFPYARFNFFVLEIISGPSCELLYATNTSHCKQKTLLYEYTLHWVLLPTKSTIERCSWVVNTSSMIAILTTETSLWTCACASVTWTVMKLGCAATLVIHIEKLLCQLQLFYFHLWSIYWLSLIKLNGWYLREYNGTPCSCSKAKCQFSWERLDWVWLYFTSNHLLSKNVDIKT